MLILSFDAVQYNILLIFTCLKHLESLISNFSLSFTICKVLTLFLNTLHVHCFVLMDQLFEFMQLIVKLILQVFIIQVLSLLLRSFELILALLSVSKEHFI